MDVPALLRDRSLRLAAALAIAIAIPVAVLFYFQFRSLSDLGKSSEVVLRQLSHETADQVTRTIEDALKAPHINVLLNIPQRQTEPLDLRTIETIFAKSLGSDSFVSRYYIWSDVTDGHRGEVLAYDCNSHGFFSPPEGALLVKRFHELAPDKRAIAAFEATIDGHRAYFQAQLRFTFPSRDRLTSFVALRVDGEQLRREFFPLFLASRLKRNDGPTGFPPLVVTVADNENRVIFPPGGRPSLVHVD